MMRTEARIRRFNGLWTATAGDGKLGAVGEFVAAPLATAEVLRAERLVAGRADQERRFNRIGRRSVRRRSAHSAAGWAAGTRRHRFGGKVSASRRGRRGQGRRAGNRCPPCRRSRTASSAARRTPGSRARAELMSTVAASSGGKDGLPSPVERRRSKSSAISRARGPSASATIRRAKSLATPSRPRPQPPCNTSFVTCARMPSFSSAPCSRCASCKFGHGRFPKIRA